MTNSISRTGVFFMAVIVSAAILPAGAKQFVFFDKDYTHTGWYTKFGIETPSNWLSPVDYRNGTAYFRCEVRSMNENSPYSCVTSSGKASTAVYYCPQVCLYPSGVSEACFASGVMCFNKAGVHYAVVKEPMYIWNGGSADWSQGVGRAMIIGKGKDSYCRIKSGMNVDMRYSIIIVEKGGTFVPPEWWGDDPNMPVAANNNIARSPASALSLRTTARGVEITMSHNAAFTAELLTLSGRCLAKRVSSGSSPATLALPAGESAQVCVLKVCSGNDAFTRRIIARRK